MKITNVNELRDAYQQKNPQGHFFDKDTLKFFEESMSSMRLLKGTREITTLSGEKHTCYVLSTFQRVPLIGRRRAHFYFDVDTLENVYVD